MKAQIAYSLLEVKAVDEERREITGIATSPEPDRIGDVVDQFGMKYADEIPLLWNHKHDKPVGHANLGRPTNSGIPFRARIAKIAEPGPMKDLVDMAWQAVKARLVKGVSIGFLPIKAEPMPRRGIKYLEGEIYELSLATIPMHAAATIQTVKAVTDRANESGVVRLMSSKNPDVENLNGAVRLIRS